MYVCTFIEITFWCAKYNQDLSSSHNIDAAIIQFDVMCDMCKQLKIVCEQKYERSDSTPPISSEIINTENQGQKTDHFVLVVHVIIFI